MFSSFLFFFPGSRCVPDLKSSRGIGCEVRTTWGHSKLFGSTGIFNCVMSRAQGSEVRGPFGFGH